MWGDWRDSYTYGTLVIWPPDDVRAVVNPLRERYDPRSAAVCEAHITLTQPFAAAPDEDLLARISDIAAKVVPISIRYGGVGTFLPYPCLFIAIAPDEPLRALHEALQATNLFHPVPEHHEHYVPHMTILEGSLASEAVADLAVELRETIPSGSFVCREIAWIVPDNAFRFAIRRTFTLGPSPQSRQPTERRGMSRLPSGRGDCQKGSR